mmetsp:Transcript_143615/g.357957  ORF Transcript_143615/g.357957 Transcript_143615/m.357957 type:complete len:209 (-) Transcript_143615:455-1081(-)
MTTATFGMSKPRAATSVAMSTGARPALNSCRAYSRCSCVRSPWMLCTLRPTPARKRSRSTACCFMFTKISTKPKSGCRRSRPNKKQSLSLSSTHASRCWMVLAVPPTRPTAMKEYVRMNSCARCWTSTGKVALVMTVCLCFGMPSCWTILRICGSKPMSSMRSASSSTKRCTLRTEHCGGFRSHKSCNRPGVATRMFAPPFNCRKDSL